MSKVTCSQCGFTWDADHHPKCPKCLSKTWQTKKNIIRPKHDPRKLPRVEGRFRSVVTYDVVTNLPVFLDAIVTSGSCFFSPTYNKYCYYVPEPVGSVSGSAVPAGYPMPVSILNSLVVADAFGNPHVYAYDSTVFEAEIISGSYVRPDLCIESGCSNLTYPGSDKCMIHIK